MNTPYIPTPELPEAITQILDEFPLAKIEGYISDRKSHDTILMLRNWFKPFSSDEVADAIANVKDAYIDGLFDKQHPEADHDD